MAQVSAQGSQCPIAFWHFATSLRRSLLRRSVASATLPEQAPPWKTHGEDLPGPEHISAVKALRARIGFGKTRSVKAMYAGSAAWLGDKPLRGSADDPLLALWGDLHLDRSRSLLLQGWGTIAHPSSHTSTKQPQTCCGPLGLPWIQSYKNS